MNVRERRNIDLANAAFEEECLARRGTGSEITRWEVERWQLYTASDFKEVIGGIIRRVSRTGKEGR